jgi:hypothetical protein
MEDNMVKIRYNLKATQDRKKRYADKNMKNREFKVGEDVLLKVNPDKSSLTIGNYTKLTARFCCSFEILNIIGPVTYILTFATSMNVNKLLHVSLLKKYEHDPNHVIELNFIQMEPQGEFQVQLVCILDRKMKML